VTLLLGKGGVGLVWMGMDDHDLVEERIPGFLFMRLRL
jgi:hypothetical protein